MSAPHCGQQAAVIMPMVSLLPLRARMQGDGGGGLAASPTNHSAFMQGAPLCRMAAAPHPHMRRQQFQPAASRDGGGGSSSGNSGGGDAGGSRQQGGEPQPLRFGEKEYEEGWLAELPDISAPSAAPAGPDSKSRGGRGPYRRPAAQQQQLQQRNRQRQQRQQDEQQPQLTVGSATPTRGRNLSRGGKRGGPSMRLHDRPPRRKKEAASASGTAAPQQLDELLERYMEDDSGGGGGGGAGGRHGKARAQTAFRPTGQAFSSFQWLQ